MDYLSEEVVCYAHELLDYIEMSSEAKAKDAEHVKDYATLY